MYCNAQFIAMTCSYTWCHSSARSSLRYGRNTLSIYIYWNDMVWSPPICNQGMNQGLRKPNEAFLHWNLLLLGLGRQIGQINSGAFGVFSAKISAPIFVQFCPCFPLLNHYFYKKTKPLYPPTKYLFGIGIWIWVAKK